MGVTRATETYADALGAGDIEFTLGQPNGVVVSFSIYLGASDVCAHIEDKIEPQKFKGTD